MTIEFTRRMSAMNSATRRGKIWSRVACLLVCGGLFSQAGTFAADPVSFRRDVAPLLLENCVACHGAKRAEGGYRVDTFAELLKKGDSGELPVGRGEGEAGELLRRLRTADEFERMPAESEPLTEEQIRVVSDWIAAGAVFDGADEDELLSFVIPAPRHPDPPASYGAVVPVTAVAFSPDGSQILAAGYHEITVWDVASARLVRRISNIGQRVFSIAFTPDGATLAVACGAPGRSGEVRLVDFASGEVKAVVGRSSDVALDVAFRPGGNELAVASADQRIRIVNLETLEVIRTLASHADWVTAVAWSKDGSRLVSAGRDKSAKVFDAGSGELLVSYKGHDAPVYGVMVSPDGQHVLSTGTDNELHRWETDSGKRGAVVPLGGQGHEIVGGDGFVLIPCADNRLLQVDLTKMTITHEFPRFGDWVLSAAWHPESARIAAGAFDGEIRVGNRDDGELPQSWIAKP